jgi:hypothetical protein
VVLWDEELAADLWTRIRNDEALLDTVKPSPKATTSPEIVDKFKTKTAAENPCAVSK